MRRLSMALIAGALGILGGLPSAGAADLSVRANPAMPSWTGFYIGGHVGSGWGTNAADVTITPVGIPGILLPATSGTVNGMIAGVQGGYNWQVGQIVVGVEGSYSWSGVSGHAPCVVVFNCTADINNVATIAGRIGVTVDRALVYVKGGIAWADFDYTFTSTI